MIGFDYIDKCSKYYKKRYNILSTKDKFNLITFLLVRFYLSDREFKIFSAYRLYLHNLRQRELSSLLNVAQPKVSKDFKIILTKAKHTVSFLYDIKWGMAKKILKSILSKHQYDVLRYLLAGNKAYWISKHLGVSPQASYNSCYLIKRKLKKYHFKRKQIKLIYSFLTQVGLLKC